MPEKLGPGDGGLGSRRPSHRFVVVVYGDAAADGQPWPGHVVHIPPSLEAAPEVRKAFDRVDRLPDLLRQLIADTGPVEAGSAAHGPA